MLVEVRVNLAEAIRRGKIVDEQQVNVTQVDLDTLDQEGRAILATFLTDGTDDPSRKDGLRLYYPHTDSELEVPEVSFQGIMDACRLSYDEWEAEEERKAKQAKVMEDRKKDAWKVLRTPTIPEAD